ncbi:exosome component 4 [Russula aff. rugulosa BPL654]|nr:exosome component 4 [Russula aff. rugulosa BPL654]
MSFDSTAQAGADGSARVAHGLTEVLVSVFGPREARVRAQTLHNRASIHVEATIAPFSANDRRRAGVVTSARVLELAATIKATFEPVVQTSLYPRSQIDIFVHVAQASINATTVALINAGVPLADYVCAITGGVHAAAPMLDLTALEETDLPHVTVASMPRSGRLTLVSMETLLHVDRFEEILRLAGEAGPVIHKEMRAVVRERTKDLLDGMSKGYKESNPAEDAMVEDE